MTRNRETQASGELKLADLQAEEGRKQQELQGVNFGNDGVSQKLLDLREGLQSVENAYSKLQARCKTMPKRIQTLEGRIFKLEEMIATENAQNLGEKGQEEIKRVQELKELREKLGEEQSSFDKLSAEIASMRPLLGKLNDEINQSEYNERRMDKDLDMLRNKVTHLSKPVASQDPSFNWGAKLPDVVALINRNSSKFRKLPIGPLGRCIKLVQETYSVNGDTVNVVRAVEAVIGKVQGMFWCDNAADQQLLLRLVSDAKLPQVRTVKQPFLDEVYSGVPMPPASDSYVRVMDTIVCDPPSVMNVSAYRFVRENPAFELNYLENRS